MLKLYAAVMRMLELNMGEGRRHIISYLLWSYSRLVLQPNYLCSSVRTFLGGGGADMKGHAYIVEPAQSKGSGDMPPTSAHGIYDFGAFLSHKIPRYATTGQTFL